MYSLFIDTHDKKVIIILYKDGKIINKTVEESKNKHSEITMPILDKTLRDSGVEPNELGEIIVVNGPGSFTGERIAVTIAKTLAFTLNIPIKAIDSLSILALNVESDLKIVAIEDRNGAFVGVFDKENSVLEDFKYLNKTDYLEYKNRNKVHPEADIAIDYEKVYEFTKNLVNLNPHEVKPLYIKGISALNDR